MITAWLVLKSCVYRVLETGAEVYGYLQDPIVSLFSSFALEKKEINQKNPSKMQCISITKFLTQVLMI